MRTRREGGAKAISDGTGHLELELIRVLLSSLFFKTVSQFRARSIPGLIAAVVNSNVY